MLAAAAAAQQIDRTQYILQFSESVSVELKAPHLLVFNIKSKHNVSFQAFKT